MHLTSNLFSGWFYHAPEPPRKGDMQGIPLASQIPGLNDLSSIPQNDEPRPLFRDTGEIKQITYQVVDHQNGTMLSSIDRLKRVVQPSLLLLRFSNTCHNHHRVLQSCIPSDIHRVWVKQKYLVMCQISMLQLCCC